MAELYTPPGWLRIEEGKKIFFRSDRESGRLKIVSRKQLRDLREIDKKFLGDAFNPELLCFSKRQQNLVSVNREFDGNVPSSSSEQVDSHQVVNVATTGELNNTETESASKDVRIGKSDREELRLKKATELLYVPVNQAPDHTKELTEAAKEMTTILEDLSNVSVTFELKDIQDKITNAGSVAEVCEVLWSEPEIQKYFSVLENSRVLSDLLRISCMSDNPLLNPVPDRKKSTYADIFFFGLKNCKTLITRLVSIVKADKGAVELSDVVIVSFYFSVLAHLASRVNNSVAKTKSLLLGKLGLSGEGMNCLAKLGITETDRNVRHLKDLLADLSETHFLAQIAAGLPYSTTADNLDIDGHHMTQAYIELEPRDTRMLDTKQQPISQVPKFFEFASINLFSDENKNLKDHLMHVVGISVARRLAEESPSSKPTLAKYLPAHHSHSHSHLEKTRAVLFIKNPEYLSETKNSEFVEYLRKEQWEFLISVAESVKDKGSYLADLQIMKAASSMDRVETEDEVKKREEAEQRVKEVVEAFGEWIGHGDALTFKMFHLGAKSLCQGGVTALERLVYLPIFRLQLLHLKFNKIYMEFGKLMANKNNINDVGTLSEFKALLPGCEKISNKDKDISKCFEFHDQFMATIFQAKAGDAWQQYLNMFPGTLSDIQDEKSMVEVMLKFLDYFDIQFVFDPERAPVDPEKYDDLENYDREGISCWISSILLDDAEAEEDPELLEALRLTIMLEFLNKNSSGIQSNKYSYLLLLDRVVERLSSERSLARMRHTVCVNPYGQLGGGLFRDKVNEHVVRMIKDVLGSLGISDNWGDLAIQKVVASVTPSSLVTEHDLLSSGFPAKFKQHSSNILGDQRKEMVRQHVTEIGTFNPYRAKVNDFIVKPRGSPFKGLTLEAIQRFLDRNLTNFKRNFPRNI